MFATLLAKLVPFKDYIYGGIIIALITGFLVFVHHERAVGAAAIKASDAKAVAAQTQLNKEIESHAQTTVAQIAKSFSDVVSKPPAADAPHLRVCQPSGAVPSSAHAGTASSADAAPVVPAAVPGSGEQPADDYVDFGPPLDKLYEDADAQVTGLQDYIKACQAAGICLK